MTLFSKNNKIAIVTGGTRGLGKAISEELKKDNYDVYAIGRTDCDVRHAEEIELYIKDFRRIDVLVNCAGKSHLGYVEETTEEDIMSVFKTNVIGTINFSKAVLPIMKKQKSGYIINLGSLRGVECSEGKTAYSMSKFAVRAFSNTFGLEIKKYGIKVTCINPGFVYTDLIKIRIKEEGLMPTDILQSIDIAKTVIYLLGLTEGAFIPEINLGQVWK